MLPLFRIWAVALYEMKALVRSILFRVFLVSLAIPAYYAVEFHYYMWTGISSLFLLNILTIYFPYFAVFVLFVATDMMMRERKTDTYGMLHARPLSNSEYLLGKAFGVFLAMAGGIEAFIIVLGIVAQVFWGAYLSAATYLIIPIMLLAPMLATLIGAAFLFTTIVRNMAFTMTFLGAGFLGVNFFLVTAWYGLFDYSALGSPLLFSDFTGFGNMASILEQRGMWLVAGLAFLFLAVPFMGRIPNSRRERLWTFLLALVCLGGSGALGNAYLSDIRSGQKLRSAMDTLSREVAKQQRVTVTDCRLDLRHNGRQIEVTTVLRFENRANTSIDRYNFTLNPGLHVLSASRNGKGMPFTRQLHMATVTPRIPLAPGAFDSLVIRYRGRIRDAACYADIDEEKRWRVDPFIHFAAKQYGFITPRYVLLTPECLWYPTAGVSFGSAFPKTTIRDFTRFSLRVDTAPKLTVISQGAVKKKGKGVWTFAPEMPLPQISLAIGDYQKKSVVVDSVEYAVYIKHGHDFFSRHLPLVKDQLPALIRGNRKYAEEYLGRSYPFPRFAIVEAPAHFHALQRDFIAGMETVQPEIVFFSEKAVNIYFADFVSNLFWFNGFGKSTRTPAEIQNGLFRNLIQMSFLNYYSRGLDRESGSLRKTFGGIQYKLHASQPWGQDLNVSPNFYRFTNAVESDSYLPVNSLFEFYHRTQLPVLAKSMNASNYEVVSATLSGRTLGEAFSDPPNADIAYEMMQCISDVFFNRLSAEVGRREFDTFIQEFLDRNRGRSVTSESLFVSFKGRFGLDMRSEVTHLINRKGLPACAVTRAQFYEIPGSAGPRFQVRFIAYNPEPVEGVFSANINLNQSDRFKPIYFSLPGGATKEIRFVVDKPFGHSVLINTLLSENRPNNFYIPLAEIEPVSDTAFEDERLLDHPPTLTDSSEVIVDNIDSGFRVLSNPEPSLLHGLLYQTGSVEMELNGKYSWWMNPPQSWRTVVDSRFYGLIKKTAFIIKPGKGENRIQWTADIPERGEYQLYYSTPDVRRFFFPNNRIFAKDFHFRIIMANGAEEQTVDLQNAEAGWTLVGSFAVPKGKTVVELSDRTKGAEVYADAVKWVKK